MTSFENEGQHGRAARRARLSRAWADLSLRTKLLLFALVLVTLPGVVFALIAFSGTRAALEREIIIQLDQTAERGADAVGAALERARSDARSWANQDIMRDLLIGDLDKRVSRFLQTVTENKAAYLEALAVDATGTVIAAGSGEWIGRSIASWQVIGALRKSGESLVGPVASPDFRGGVLQIGIAVHDPDPPRAKVGSLILVYDWREVESLLDGIRRKLTALDKNVAAIVVDADGKVIGGVSFDGSTARTSALASERWRPHATHRDEVLVGSVALSGSPAGWSVLFLERKEEALAAVQQVRDRWIWMITAILAVGLAVAAWLARQFMRPLDEVTRATSDIASHPEQELPLLPVRSRNEVGQLTDSFNKMTVELKRSQEEALHAAKFAFAGELAAMIAHEVRTPLSVMRSSAQLLAKPKADTARDGELANTIVAEVDRVERVVNGLLQLAKPLEQKLEATALPEILERAADFVAPEAERHGIRLSCDLAADQPPAFCDREQIYQVILNLVVNALQALPPGGSIELSTLPAHAGFVGFRIADDGPGLPADLRERIFRPFVTGREEGTGLGLAFVDRIVKAHRGIVTVQTESNKGTAFAVQLLIADTSASEVAMENPGRRT
jgi:signal transduction histidine kinase